MFKYSSFLMGLVLVTGGANFAFVNSSLAEELPPTVKTEEVLLGNVFIPEWGYGTNNNIQLTLDGYLPNSCYQLGKAEIAVNSDTGGIIVHQYAEVETDGVCADMHNLPPHLSNIIPYTYDVSLGRLTAGTYKIIFNELTGTARTRIFHIYRSRNPSADDLPYAAISTISMPDVVNGLYPLTIELLGSFTSTCSFLADLKIVRQNDVIVVQPVLGYRHGVICTQALVPFRKAFELRDLTEGRYLLHVRSMSGNSVSHAFSVIKSDPGP